MIKRTVHLHAVQVVRDRSQFVRRISRRTNHIVPFRITPPRRPDQYRSRRHAVMLTLRSIGYSKRTGFKISRPIFHPSSAQPYPPAFSTTPIGFVSQKRMFIFISPLPKIHAFCRSGVRRHAPSLCRRRKRRVRVFVWPCKFVEDSVPR